MFKERSYSEHLFITLFVAYTYSKVIALAFSEASLPLLVVLMALIITAFIIYTNYLVIQILLFTGIALQLIDVLEFMFSMEPITLLACGGSILFLLILSSYMINDKATNQSLTLSLLAASSLSVLYLLIENSTLYLILYLTYPVAVACIYVSLSKKTEYGFTIVTLNTAVSIAATYLMSFLIGISMMETIILATWISSLLISFIYNSESKLEFKLGYQRFLSQKENLKKEIFLLKRALFNANEMPSTDLLEVVNSLNEFKRERILKNLSPGTITRFDLQDRHKQLKATAWLLVFCAYVTYGASAYYVSKFSYDYLIAFLIFGPIYFLSVPYITIQILYKNLIRQVNKQFIIPYNKLMDTRDNLREELSNLLIKKGG